VSQATIAIPDSLIRVRYGLAAEQLGAEATAAAAGGDLETASALRQQATELGATALTTPANGLVYRAVTDSDRQTSYIVGAAYERPEIALRVALTYESGYKHSFESIESFGGIPTEPMTTNIIMPDVYTLDFQSGVATDTLVFGSIRHATWSDWEVRPPVYGELIPAVPAGSARVTFIASDTTTYRIGVGRKFTDAISGFARITYEAGDDNTLSRLSPTDGSIAYGFGGSYTNGAIKVTGGVEYITFGEGDDNENALLATNFADNDAVAVGLSVGYRF
jgi:long-subunit fatty acid transport protein